MKKTFAVILSFILICFSLLGCDNSNNQSELENSIRKYTTKGKSSQSFSIDKSIKGELVVNVNEVDYDTSYDNSQGYPVEKAISAFKKYYPNVKLTINHIPHTLNISEIEDYYKKLSTEIMAGKGPDLFSIRPLSYIDIDKMMSAGVFADMYEYFENDKTFNINEYQKDAFYSGQRNGKQFLIPCEFRIPFLLTTESAIEEYDIHPEKITDYYALYDEINKFLTKQPEHKNPFNGRMYLMNTLWYSNVNWINIEKQSVDVKNNKDLKKVYKTVMDTIIKRFPENATNPNRGSLLDSAGQSLALALKNHQCLLSDQSYDFGSLIKSANIINRTEDKAGIIPIRNIDGGITASTLKLWGISNNSKNKDNAYRFIKLLLSEECNSLDALDGDQQTVPINIKAMKNYIHKILSTDGLFGEAEYDEKAQNFMNTYLSYFDEIDSAMIYPTRRCDIILYESLEPYWKGEKSYEDCIKNIEEKLEIYLSE